MLRRIILLLVALWLLWLGALIALLPYDEYGSGVAIPDCDTDAELFLMLASWIVWLSMAVYGLWFLAIGRFGENRLALAVLVLALLVSGGVLVKYIWLMAYLEQVEKLCGA